MYIINDFLLSDFLQSLQRFLSVKFATWLTCLPLVLVNCTVFHISCYSIISSKNRWVYYLNVVYLSVCEIFWLINIDFLFIYISGMVHALYIYIPFRSNILLLETQTTTNKIYLHHCFTTSTKWKKKTSALF